MASTLKFRRDTTTNLGIETGALGEIFIDTTKKVVVVMDGSTPGGTPLQAELVSGTNIKTINGTSLLGSGDITISGGDTYSNTNVQAYLTVNSIGSYANANVTAYLPSYNGNIGKLTITDTRDNAFSSNNALYVAGGITTVGNIASGGILTDNYYYANGSPVSFGGGTSSKISSGASNVTVTSSFVNVAISSSNIASFSSSQLTVAGGGRFEVSGNPYVSINEIAGKVYSWYGEFNSELIGRQIIVGNRGQRMSGYSSSWNVDMIPGIVCGDNSYIESGANVSIAFPAAGVSGSNIYISKSTLSSTYPALESAIQQIKTGWYVKEADYGTALAAGTYITAITSNGSYYTFTLSSTAYSNGFFIAWQTKTAFGNTVTSNYLLNNITTGNVNVKALSSGFSHIDFIDPYNAWSSRIEDDYFGAQLNLYPSNSAHPTVRITAPNYDKMLIVSDLTSPTTSSTNDGILLSTSSDSGIYIYNDTSGVDAKIETSGGNLRIGTMSLNQLDFVTDDTTRMSIDANGNVGIGTTTTAGGKTTIQTTSDAAPGGIALLLSDSTGSSANQFGIAFNSVAAGNAGSSRLNYYVDAGGATAGLTFLTGGATPTERMRIDSSGSVLVGTTSMATGFTARLNSSITGSVWAAQFENNATTYDTLILSNHATSGNNRFIGFGTEATWTERGYIYYDRAAGQTKLSATSDYRAKDIVGDTVGALDLVSSIKVKDAKLKWAEGQAYPMYIAHELQEVAPWAVSGEKDAVDEEGKPVYQTVSYESMVATLTAAIQELKAENDDLKARIIALESK